MTPLKAWGPEEMPPIFYQYHWQNIGDNVTDAILYYLNTKKIFRFESYLYYCYSQSKVS